MRRKFVLGGLGCGLLLSATALMVAAQTDGGEDPIVLFTKLMPVLVHPRCMNCHGGVNPFAGNSHGGGVIVANFDVTVDMSVGTNNRGCLSCHDERTQDIPVVAGPNPLFVRSGNWRLAPRHLAFVGKSARELCQQLANFSRLESHLELDQLIDMGFVGRRGGATDDADPPSMSKAEFLAAADTWLNDGGRLCGGWTGTITQTETFIARYNYPLKVGSGPSTTSVAEDATRTMTITLGKGAATSESTMSGHRTVTMVMHGVKPNGSPCISTVTNNSPWKGIGTNAGEARVRVKITPDGNYTIRFIGPVEKTLSGGNTVSTGNCGPNFSDPPSDPDELEWPSKPFFTVKGSLPDPRDRRHLKDTIKSDGKNAAYPKTWLDRSPVGIARVDSGERIPIAVEIKWDLTLEE